MSRQASPSKPINPVSFFSIIRSNGGYSIIEIIYDVNNNKLIEVKKPTEAEVLPIVFTQLQRKFLNNLGL